MNNVFAMPAPGHDRIACKAKHAEATAGTRARSANLNGFRFVPSREGLGELLTPVEPGFGGIENPPNGGLIAFGGSECPQLGEPCAVNLPDSNTRLAHLLGRLRLRYQSQFLVDPYADRISGGDPLRLGKCLPTTGIVSPARRNPALD
ncbi:MAG: hypothetical protein V3V29_05605 [Acidimicrobiia bacterium]